MHPDVRLANRLMMQEYLCHMTRKIVKHLNAHGRAKAAPKTKSYAMDADAVEDPGIERDPEGGGEGDFEDMMEPDLDGEVKPKPGDAPLKVYHPLSSTARTQALLFHRQRISKFVKEVIDNGLLKFLANEDSLTTACERNTEATPAACNSEQLRLKARLPTINQSLLDA